MKGQISLLTLQIGEFTKVASNKLCIVKKYTICYFSATKVVRDQNQTNMSSATQQLILAITYGKKNQRKHVQTPRMINSKNKYSSSC